MARPWDAVIIGGGVVGTALLRALTRYPGRWLLLEKEGGLARHTSGRNSGVIHSGVYNRPGTLKAELAARGVPALYRYCAARGVPHQRTGKLIVAVRDEEIPRIEQLERQAKSAGITAERCTPAEAREHEPEVACRTGLWVPLAGIVDSVRLVHSLAEDARDAGGEFRTGSGMSAIQRHADGLVIDTPRGAVETRFVVNCAGLHADEVAHALGTARGLAIVPFRGDYRALAPGRAHLVRGLIYPAKDPDRPFLGVHLTRTITGKVLVGPNATIAPAREAYEGFLPRRGTGDLLAEPAFWAMVLGNKAVRGHAAEEFRLSVSRSAMADEAARMLPALRRSDLVAAHHSGIRAQVVERSTGALVEDLRLEQQPDALHVLNAVSPALTNSLAFAEYLVDRLRRPLGLPARNADDKPWVERGGAGTAKA